MQSIKIKKTNDKSVSCDGDDSASGHPKIYLEIDREIGKISCPYCGKIFELNK